MGKVRPEPGRATVIGVAFFARFSAITSQSGPARGRVGTAAIAAEPNGYAGLLLIDHA